PLVLGTFRRPRREGARRSWPRARGPDSRTPSPAPVHRRGTRSPPSDRGAPGPGSLRSAVAVPAAAFPGGRGRRPTSLRTRRPRLSSSPPPPFLPPDFGRRVDWVRSTARSTGSVLSRLIPKGLGCGSAQPASTPNGGLVGRRRTTGTG